MKLLTLAFLLCIQTVIAAEFKGSISFTEVEKRKHLINLSSVLEDAANCLKEDLDHHLEFYKRWGISPFYGDNSKFHYMSREQKLNRLRSLNVPTRLLDQMRTTSCIGLTVKCMERSFNKYGQSEIWRKLKRFTALNDYDGTALQEGLRKLGWTVFYWNPDPSQNSVWDKHEREKDPTNRSRFWGYHVYRHTTVNSSRRRYYMNTVDNIIDLVNFGTRVPRKMNNVPFFVGTAHTGYHVFPGAYGQVIEGHSTRLITDPQTIETSMFNPLANGGGPRGSYRSGLMALPPNYTLY